MGPSKRTSLLLTALQQSCHQPCYQASIVAKVWIHSLKASMNAMQWTRLNAHIKVCAWGCMILELPLGKIDSVWCLNIESRESGPKVLSSKAVFLEESKHKPPHSPKTQRPGDTSRSREGKDALPQKTWQIEAAQKKSSRVCAQMVQKFAIPSLLSERQASQLRRHTRCVLQLRVPCSDRSSRHWRLAVLNWLLLMLLTATAIHWQVQPLQLICQTMTYKRVFSARSQRWMVRTASNLGQGFTCQQLVNTRRSDMAVFEAL